MSLLSNGSAYIVGEVVSKLIPFLMLPYLTRKLGVEGFGDLAYYLMIYTFSLIFISISQAGALTRYYFRYGHNGIPSVMLAGFSFAFISTLLIITALVIGGGELYIFPVLLAFTQTIVSSLLSQRQCKQEVFRYIQLQFLISLSVSLLTIFAFEWINTSAIIRINSLIAGQILSIFFVFIFAIPKIGLIKFSFYKFKLHLLYTLGFGLPLIIHQISFFGKGQFDRFLIPQKFTLSELGLYSAAFQLASILTVLLYAVNKAIVPVLYLKLKNKELSKQDILYYARKSLLITPIPALIAYLLPKELYVVVLGDGFDGAKYFVYTFLIGLALHFPYQILANFLFYHGQNRTIATITMLSLVVHVLFVLLFAHLSQLSMMPYAIAISNATVIGLLYANIRKHKN